MDTGRLNAIIRSWSGLPSRRDVLRGLAGVGLVLTALRGGDAALAKKRHHKHKHKHKPKQKLPSPPTSPPPSPPPSFNTFGCLDVGQPCHGDSTLCCSGTCDPSTSTCVAHNSGICAPDSDTCTVGGSVPCDPNNPNSDGVCLCMLTTGNAGFCGLLTDISDPVELCRFCSQDTDCQEEFGAGAACVVLGGICTPICGTTGRTACVRPCA